MGSNNTTTKLTIIINGKEVEKSLNGMGKELKELNKEVRNMNEGDPNFKKRVDELNKLKSEYNKLRTEVYGANNATNNFKEGLKGVGAGIAAAFTIDKVLEFSKLIYENVERVRALKTEISGMTGLDGSQLSSATTQTMSIAEVYKKDEKEVVSAANAMSKALKISYADALDEITKGFKEGADASGDMLEQIKEYAPFIKEAGGEAKDLINIVKQGVVDGVYNDKAIDAVKEGLLRIREMTPATRDAITNLGIDVDDMLSKISKGQLSYMDAMMLVSKEMDKLGNKSTVTGQALADIFGGPGEDAGFQYISNLYKMNSGVSNLTKSQIEYNRVKDLELEASQKSAILFEQLTGEGSKLNEFLIEGKLALVEFTSALFGISEAKASDDIRNQQVSLKMLQNELLNTNTSTSRRKEILEQIQSIYPEIFKNLDLEKASNEELSTAIDRVSESLKKRYSIQLAKEKISDAEDNVGDYESRKEQVEAEIKELISVLQTDPKYKINLSAEFNSKGVLDQAKEVNSQLTNGFWESYFRTSDKSKLTGLISDLSMTNGYLVDAKNNLEDILKVQNRVINNAKLPVEDYRSYFENYSKQEIADWKSKQGSNADAGRADELKRQAKEVADARKRAQKEAEQAAKKIQETRIREAKGLHDALLKEEESFRKKLFNSENEESQSYIDLMKDGLNKELEQQKLNSEKRTLALSEEINQINQLKIDYENKAQKLREFASKAGKGEKSSTYSADAQKYTDLANQQAAIIANKNSTIQALEQKSNAEKLTIYSKYRAKEVELRQKANDDLFNSLKIQYNEELSSATTLEETKSILKEKYGVTELNHITTLTDARNELMKEQNKAMLDEQLSALKIELSQIQELLDEDSSARGNGLQILTDEERDKQIENIKSVGLAISEIDSAISGEKVNKTEEQKGKEKKARSQILSGIDLLGFSADDWSNALEQLDSASPGIEKFAAKIQLVEMALQTVSNAWGMMVSAQNSALDRSLKRYERYNDARKSSLEKQLNDGIISQESYNAQVELLDEAMAAKKAEISYKQAMNEWKMQLMSGLANTALAVTGALGMKPWTPANYAFAAIVGGLGAIQTGIIAANKPQKSNYYATGGDTKGLGYIDETGHEVAGTVHANEYVIPEWLLKDPIVANMKEFIESRRLGESKSTIPNSYATGGNVTTPEILTQQNVSNDIAVFSVLTDLNQQIMQSNILYQRLLSEGVTLRRTLEGAKKMKEDIAEYDKLTNKQKK